METYLNLAHRSHRKAEFYTKNQQFYQAIYHHKVASEYLDKAIVQTHCDTIRTSLIIQRSHNISQIDFLTRRLAYQLNSDNKAPETGRAGESPSDPNSTATQPHPISKMALEQIEQKYHELYQVINEQDSLIQGLLEADTNYENRSEKAKEDKDVIEQLQTVNEKMRQMISSLVEKLEKSNEDCKALRDENERLKKEITQLKNRPDNHPELPELPPLEPPTLFY